jgi:hypothetical protein
MIGVRGEKVRLVLQHFQAFSQFAARLNRHWRQTPGDLVNNSRRWPQLVPAGGFRFFATGEKLPAPIRLIRSRRRRLTI